MRTGKLFFLFPLLALFLTACGGTVGDRDREAFLGVRAALLARESITLRADLRADYGDRVYDYRLTYTGGSEGGKLRVEEPLELAEVEVELEKDHARVRYGDLLLDTGAIAARESPVQAFPLMIRAWLRGSVAECWQERLEGVDCVAAEIHLGEAGAEDRLLCRAWFRRDTGEPVYAELSKDSRVCIFCHCLPPEEKV